MMISLRTTTKRHSRKPVMTSMTSRGQGCRVTSAGRTAPVRTYQDLLASAHDEALFDYYATSQLAFVDAATGQRTPVGAPAVFVTAAPSPSSASPPTR